jgi:hypothetical protein
LTFPSPSPSLIDRFKEVLTNQLSKVYLIKSSSKPEETCPGDLVVSPVGKAGLESLTLSFLKMARHQTHTRYNSLKVKNG